MPDAYTRKARIAPAALVGVPGGALLIAGAISPDTVLRAIGVFLGALGILVAVLIRDAGRSVQPRLWEDWAGRRRPHGSAGAVTVPLPRYSGCTRE